jgi:hypothetical protein
MSVALTSASGQLTVVPDASVVEVVMFDGTETEGAVVSCTVTVIVFETVLASSSVAVHTTDVAPIGYDAVTSKSPDPLPPGSHDALIGFPEAGSYALTWYVTLAPAALVASVGPE